MDNVDLNLLRQATQWLAAGSVAGGCIEDELAAQLSRCERVRTIATRNVQLQTATPNEPMRDELQLTDTTLTTDHGPRWRRLLLSAPGR